MPKAHNLLARRSGPVRDRCSRASAERQFFPALQADDLAYSPRDRAVLIEGDGPMGSYIRCRGPTVKREPLGAAGASRGGVRNSTGSAFIQRDNCHDPFLTLRVRSREEPLEMAHHRPKGPDGSWKSGQRVPESGPYVDQHGFVSYHETSGTFPPCIGREGECAYRRPMTEKPAATA